MQKIVTIFFVLLFHQDLFAACTGTSITWGGSSLNWNTAANWSPANVPNTNIEDVIISSGAPIVNLTTSIGCLTFSAGTFNGNSVTARVLTYQGDSFTSTVADGLVFTTLSIVMGPHTTPANPQTFTMNQTGTIKALTVASTSTPASGFGATVTNTNAGTATITTLANTGLNTSKYVGNITATAYTNNKANTLDIENGIFTVNSISASNTVTGGVLNINPGSTLKTTTTFNPVAGFTTNILNGSPQGALTVTTTSAPSGVLNVNGTMSTKQFNSVAGSATSISATGSITATISSTPRGSMTIDGAFTSPTFAPTSTITINSSGSVNATTSSIPSLTAALTVYGTLTTPTFSPASGAVVTVKSGGLIDITTNSVAATTMTIESGGQMNAVKYTGSSTSTVDIYGTMTVSNFTPGAGAKVNVKSGGVLNVTTFTPNATALITVESGGTLNVTSITNAMAATISINGTMNVTNLPAITSGTLDIKNGGLLYTVNGLTINGATVKVQAGGTLRIANGKTLTLSSGNFQVLGTEDDFPQDHSTKGVVEAASGTFAFTTTAGTLSLTGFHFDRLDVNGLKIGGTTIVSNLRGGQLTNLPVAYSSVKAIQINTTGTIPVSASRIAWNWGAFNVFTGTNPTSSQAYKLISSTGCASHSIDFSGWTGDWYEAQPNFDVTTKISKVSCNISLSSSVSAVSLMSFNAVAFNNAIDVRWRTNAERNHLGFNVYRADLYSAQFQQINKTLIRNLKNSSSNQASYRFIDHDVTNGQIYYYYIEDVEVGGKKVLHGPVSATPLAGLGNPPADNVDENSDSNSNDGDDGGSSSPSTIPNPSYEDLGNGVVILSKTSSSIRVQITPAAPQFVASAWNNSYQDVGIAGYSKMTVVGSPELPEKDILIEVQSFAETAELINQAITENTLASHLISPSPSYSLNGSGVLEPSYSPDVTRYSSSTNYPSTYFNIQSELVAGANSKFLKIKVHPLKLNPVTQSISMATKIVLDIGLNGDDWDVHSPGATSELSKYSIANTLRIDVSKGGMYQLTYSDLINSEVDGPFVGKPVNQFRLYNKDQEIPLEVYSSSGNFSSGDYIRFYIPFTKELESKTNRLILSPVNLNNDSSYPMRIEDLESDPTGQSDSLETIMTFTKTFEQNLFYVDGLTLNDNLDHFFYANLVNYLGMDTLSLTAALPEIDTANVDDVQVKFYVRGRPGMSGLPVKHDVQFLIGNTVRGSLSFDENERSVITFNAAANLFTTGNNTIKLKVTGAYAPATDNDFVLVDKVEILYKGFLKATNNTLNTAVSDILKNHTFTGFSSNSVLCYDITSALEIKKITNMSITTSDGGVSYTTTFLSDDQTNSDGFKEYTLSTTNALLRPAYLSLNPGLEQSLRSPYNRADLVVYGSETLLDAARDLIDRRMDQGLEVMTLTPEQVYSEFSYGIQKSKALKDLMATALAHWEKAPKYLLILGDGTFDPLDYNVNALASGNRSALEKFTLPAPLIAGRFIDFSTDNYFVSSEVSHAPQLSVGRLPTNNPAVIKAYVEKLIKYEEGEFAPSITNLKKMSFFADEDTGEYEHFNDQSQSMMSTADGFTTSLFDRTQLGSKAATKSKINSEFSEGPLLISMMGHGAFDRFGDDIFNSTDAKSLSNTRLPIVAAWNCETAYFYDADKTYKSLGEELVLNSNGGAIVFIGSTTQTTPPAQVKMAHNFFGQLSSNVKNEWIGTRFGDIVYQAKLSTGTDDYEKDIVNSFSIIGDPSLKLPSDLYPAGAHAAAPAAASQKSFFGCSAHASENGTPSPWHEGLLEWIFYMFLIVYGTRKVLRT